MEPATLDTVLMTHLRLMRERLDEAAGLGRAAETCGNSGNIEKALQIALEVEQLTYEVNTPECGEPDQPGLPRIGSKPLS